MQLIALLEVTDYTKPIESTADKLAFGGQMLLIGLGIVFGVLILLWLSLELFRLLFSAFPKTACFKSLMAKCNALSGRVKGCFRRDAAPAKEPTPAPAPKPKKEKKKAQEPVKEAPAASASVDNTELVAVLAAAIAASEDAPISSFRVVSFRRV